MATERDENPYGGGLGTGGKFRKRPFRRAQTTPYDRPPIALRNQTNDGWLSKIVDPAQRFITYGAHRLFSSVFRRRLPPVPTPPPLEPSEEICDTHQEAVVSDPAAVQEGPVVGVGNPSSNFDRGGLMELEQILEQKTFTREEIDRLTALLHSKTADTLVSDERKRNDMINLKPMVSHDRKEELPNTPVPENGIRSRLTSTPVISKRVVEDVASPAELAKAYMGSRSSKVSPSKLGLHSQALKEDSTVMLNVPFPSKSPSMSLVPRSSSYRGVPENGFITPRSRGRSAIYDMARTPYSRNLPSSSLKISGRTSDNYCGPTSSSSSQFPWEQHGPYGSKHGDLKRRSSVLDNDIGSGGPIRRIRQKQNFASPKNFCFPVSGSGVGSTFQHPTSSTQKTVLLRESKQNFQKITENGDHNVPSTSYNPVPSKSSEMASKILQQLDKLASKEKASPTSASIVHGQSLRSLKTVDSSKFLENVRDSNILDNLSSPLLTDPRNPSYEKGKKVEGNGPVKFIAPTENSIDSKTIQDTPPDVGTTITKPLNLVAYPPQKKRSFQMSAHEDFQDLDDVYTNGTAAVTPLTEGREKPDASVTERKIVATESLTVEKTSTLSEAKPIVSFEGNTRSKLGSFDGSVVAEKKSSSPTVSPVSMFVPPPVVASQSILTSDKDALPKESNAASPIFNFGDKVASTKEANAVFPKFNFSSKNVDSVQQFAFAPSSTPELHGPKFVTSDPKPKSSISSATADVSSTDFALKGLESDRSHSQNSLASGVFSSAMANSSSISTSTVTANIFSFGAPPNNMSSNNGSLASSKFLFSSTTPPLVFSSATSAATTISPVIATATTTTITAINTTSSNSSPSTSVSFPSAPIFKFGSISSTGAPQVSAASGSVEAKVNQDRGFGNLTSSPLTSAGSTNIGFSAAAAPIFSTASNQTQNSTPFSGGSGSLPSAQLSPASSGVATFTQNTPNQVGSSPSFGSAGITAFSAGNSQFGSSAPASKLFSSGSTFGLNSSKSTIDAGSSLQPTKSPIFGSTSSSTGFSFGTSSASNGVTNSPPVMFGFTTATSTTSSQPVFGSPTPAFSFGSAPSGNNDQMNMEDSMAEDSVLATAPTVSVFGQQTIAMPPSSFVFGSAAPSVANPFQFGGQPNLATPQNSSPFQASGSLEFSAGGSFSLGTGGGDKSGRRFVKVRKTRKK